MRTKPVQQVYDDYTAEDFAVWKIQHDFRTDIIQEDYYVIDSFRQLANSLEEIEEALFVQA